MTAKHRCSCVPKKGNNAFDSFGELELHIDVGVHETPNRKKESLYDTIRRNWAEKFSSIDSYQRSTTPNQPGDFLVSSEGTSPTLNIGWALGKPRTGGVRFSEKVRMYLTAKFEVGERTGRKADPEQVALSMRSARNERNERLFERDEWLTKTQITGYFSRLSSRQSSRGQEQASSTEEKSGEDEDDLEACIRELDRCVLMENIDEEIGLKHPIVFDAYDLCDYHKQGKLEAFNVAMLKTILRHFEVSFRAKDRKADLIRLDLLKEIIQECQCSKD